jgi:hypothetical protein
MSKSKQIGNEPKRWLDEPDNVRKIIRGFYWLCGLVIVADLIFTLGWHKHAAFAEDFSLRSVETLPAFYGIYGFLACVGLVYVSKLMRDWKGKKTLMREEDYWDK